MANAFKCERCEKFQEGEPAETIPLKREKQKRERGGFSNFNGTTNHETVIRAKKFDAELCDSCQERLANFLNGKLGFPDP